MGSVLSARRISVVLRAASFVLVLVLETDLFDVIALPLFHLRMIVHRKEEVIILSAVSISGSAISDPKNTTADCRN